MSARTTTILGVTYQGRPKMNSQACRIWLLEQDGKVEEASKLLRAYRMLGPVDLQADMIDLPMEGVQVYPARPERIEEKSLPNGWNRWAA